MYHRYADRRAAGKILGETLAKHPFRGKVVVVGLPRGGIPVGFEVAHALKAPLDFLVARKIGAPGHGELACGAFIVGGEVVWNSRVMRSLGLTSDDLERTHQLEIKEAQQRESLLRTPETSVVPFKGASILIVDDGLATGATMKAAVKGVLAREPAEVLVVIPVGPVSTCRDIEAMGVSLVCDQRVDEESFSSVGQWYRDFSQVTTEECKELLLKNRAEFPASSESPT